MKFTNEQKLIAAMLAEIHQKLGISDGVRSSLVSKALWSGNEWAITWEHGYLLEQTENPPHVKHVVAVMEMWTLIEHAYAKLTTEERQRFSKEAYPYGEPTFPGFDGNEEGEYLSAARFLIDELRRFSNFAGRGDLNSHHPTIDASERMLSAFSPIRKTLGIGQKRSLTVDDLIEVFRTDR